MTKNQKRRRRKKKQKLTEIKQRIRINRQMTLSKAHWLTWLTDRIEQFYFSFLFFKHNGHINNVFIFDFLSDFCDFFPFFFENNFNFCFSFNKSYVRMWKCNKICWKTNYLTLYDWLVWLNVCKIWNRC